LIVGSGPEGERLQSQARQLGILEKCVFVPATDRVAAWLRAMDIFVLPSLSEAFSNSLMEAMACGCCPVASRVGGNPELLGDSERGVLFEAGNPVELAAVLHSLIGDRQRREVLAAAAASFIRSGFSIESSAARMQEIYSNRLTA